MLIIVEIILTIAAWRKGWRWLALLPLSGVLGIAFLIGFLAGAVGSEQDLIIPCLLLDLSGLIALIVMTAQKPKKLHNKELSVLSGTPAQENG